MVAIEDPDRHRSTDDHQRQCQPAGGWLVGRTIAAEGEESDNNHAAERGIQELEQVITCHRYCLVSEAPADLLTGHTDTSAT